MVAAPAAILALLTLKPRDEGRRGHIDDFHTDEAPGLFAGLNGLPEGSLATDPSYRTTREDQLGPLRGRVPAPGAAPFPAADAVARDFHPIPDRGDPTGLDPHSRPPRGAAGPRVRTSFAPEQEGRCPGYANANPTRVDRPAEARRRVESRRAITGRGPRWPAIDPKVGDYPESSRIDDRGLQSITIGRRGAAILRRPEAPPRPAWTGAVLDPARRGPRPIRDRDEPVEPRGSGGPIRRIAVDGPGREELTLSLTNRPRETAPNRIIRPAGRDRVEAGLGLGVNSCHRDRSARQVRRNGDPDAALTALAHGGYRRLGKRLRGHETAARQRLSRSFVEAAGTVKVEDAAIGVRSGRRGHNPIPREAALDREAAPMPWPGDRRTRFAFD